MIFHCYDKEGNLSRQFDSFRKVKDKIYGKMDIKIKNFLECDFTTSSNKTVELTPSINQMPELV